MRAASLLFLWSLAIVQATAAEGPRFVAARYDEKQRIVRFESPIEIDWKAAARRHFRRFNPERLTTKDIDYLRERIWEISGDAEEVFRFSPNASVRRTTYYMISARGVGPLNIAAFEGKIRFEFDHKKPPNLGSVMYFGEAISRPGQGTGGFALISRYATPPQPIASARAELVEDSAAYSLVYTDDQTRITASMPKEDRPYKTIDVAFAFRVGEGRYLFVDWPEDKEGSNLYCADGYSLYEIGATLKEIGSNFYNCDV